MQRIKKYINNINRLYLTGNAREHSYRGDLQHLLNEIINDKDIVVTNEPARIINVGAPDYSITKNEIPIGYIEAKDIGKPLASKDYQEQFDRYKNALDNLIITDYLDFWFYKNGELTTKIQIAKIENNQIIILENNLELFINSILSFTSFITQTITSPNKLAKLMAGKARLLESVIEMAILSDEDTEANNSLRNQLEIFKTSLIHDITPQSFADIYAQTIAYGMFAARLHDKTLENFSREEAVFLIPKSNPFLRSLFSYISGPECDDRLIWIIDSLAEIFLATDVKKLLTGFSQKVGMNDPIIHFYETFLGEYNPLLRKSRGVWYTPEPIVNFIIRATDEILKNDFNIEDGISDESKIKIKIDDLDSGFNKNGQRKQQEIEVHKIQILDPATGTATFISEIIKFVKKNFWGGSWSSYVEESLIPRLNGFELLMASYAMAHLKLDLLLLETGYKPINQKRFNIFLTNSLESHHEYTGSLFASYLANESKAADRVKKELPVMVVVGNPPYAISSCNKSKWIQNLVQDYKKNLNERKINLDDDYIKFIRYGQYHIDKNGEGILAYISNNSFIDGITHRQMRKSLLESFDKIYILDLHGNSKKQETCLDGSKDENVFDIMQGVSINIFIKKKNKSKQLAEVFHYDLQGKRTYKYDYLSSNNINTIKWTKLDYSEPNYFFVPKDFSKIDSYSEYIKVDELFNIYNSGIQTKRDNLTIQTSIDDLLIVKKDLTTMDEASIRSKYELSDSRDWELNKAIKDLYSNDNIQPIEYRPFDTRYTFLSKSSKSFLAYPRYDLMKHMTKDNYGLIFERGHKNQSFNQIFIVNKIIEVHLMGTMNSNAYISPLYLYDDLNLIDNNRQHNLNIHIINQIESKLNLKFVNEKIDDITTFSPIDILDYVYSILHHPVYIDKYKEFLKIDFPKIPFPKIDTFWKLVNLGKQLRSIHLLEDISLNDRIIDIIGDNELLISNKLSKKDIIIENDTVIVKLNENISLINIPLIAWESYIGSYQPAQKWLKDKYNKILNRSDLKHYNKIINALYKSNLISKLLKEIDLL